MFTKTGKKLMQIAQAGLLLAGLTFGQASTLTAQSDERKVKTQVKPVFPDLARKMRLSGRVRIEVTISPEGAVKNTRVLGGHPVLVESAQSAVKGWKFEPASGETTQVVDFVFALAE